ncbi:hypothetical protein CROQUDRAFT_674118 [Cronartium quercuum f. sp. fusiforme G11]|uniref:Rho-GAP domain-containing protein n=1 Tax=Cronartium quercuum f. sp. fusiforme G11 TaxID=708437 RepID=A0A9P6N9B8_9BASI|nr:hypothetical protein CROQUDRAFT_674118 [Cronartium quercuum f. sp. fusiforme G11]
MFRSIPPSSSPCPSSPSISISSSFNQSNPNLNALTPRPIKLKPKSNQSDNLTNSRSTKSTLYKSTGIISHTPHRPISLLGYSTNNNNNNNNNNKLIKKTISLAPNPNPHTPFSPTSPTPSDTLSISTNSINSRSNYKPTISRSFSFESQTRQEQVKIIQTSPHKLKQINDNKSNKTQAYRTRTSNNSTSTPDLSVVRIRRPTIVNLTNSSFDQKFEQPIIIAKNRLSSSLPASTHNQIKCSIDIPNTRIKSENSEFDRNSLVQQILSPLSPSRLFPYPDSMLLPVSTRNSISDLPTRLDTRDELISILNDIIGSNRLKSLVNLEIIRQTPPDTPTNLSKSITSPNIERDNVTSPPLSRTASNGNTKFFKKLRWRNKSITAKTSRDSLTQSSILTDQTSSFNSIDSEKPTFRLIGISLPDTACASCVTVIGGQKHLIPIMIFKTIEEIYRRGMKTPGLFKTSGNNDRIQSLIKIFETPPSYGDTYLLDKEDIFNLCGLLKRFLQALPQPLIVSSLSDLFWNGCVLEGNPNEEKSSRITTAQVIFRLLPKRSFSLLVYVVAFLSQVQLFPENQMDNSSVSHIFGPALLAPRNAGVLGLGPSSPDLILTRPPPVNQLDPAETSQRAIEGLIWLLNNWNRITDGLLDERIQRPSFVNGQLTSPVIAVTPKLLPVVEECTTEVEKEEEVEKDKNIDDETDLIGIASSPDNGEFGSEVRSNRQSTVVPYPVEHRRTSFQRTSSRSNSSSDIQVTRSPSITISPPITIIGLPELRASSPESLVEELHCRPNQDKPSNIPRRPESSASQASTTLTGVTFSSARQALTGPISLHSSEPIVSSAPSLHKPNSTSVTAPFSSSLLASSSPFPTSTISLPDTPTNTNLTSIVTQAKPEDVPLSFPRRRAITQINSSHASTFSDAQSIVDQYEAHGAGSLRRRVTNDKVDATPQRRSSLYDSTALSCRSCGPTNQRASMAGVIPRSIINCSTDLSDPLIHSSPRLMTKSNLIARRAMEEINRIEEEDADEQEITNSNESDPIRALSTLLRQKDAMIRAQSETIKVQAELLVESERNLVKLNSQKPIITKDLKLDSIFETIENYNNFNNKNLHDELLKIKGIWEFERLEYKNEKNKLESKLLDLNKEYEKVCDQLSVVRRAIGPDPPDA